MSVRQCLADASGARREAGRLDSEAWHHERLTLRSIALAVALRFAERVGGRHGAHPFAQAHVLLFGIFALAGVPGMLAIDRRTRRRMGPEEWQRLAARTSLLPGSALLTGRWRADPRRLSWPRLALGVLHYAAILLLHRPVIGVSPRRVL